MPIKTENYPLDSRRAEIDDEKVLPNDSLQSDFKMPTIEPIASTGEGSVGTMKMPADVASFDERATLSEKNVRLKYVNTDGLPQDN